MEFELETKQAKSYFKNDPNLTKKILIAYLIVIIGSILLQFAVMEVPFLSKALKTSSIPLNECMLLFLISLTILIVVEIQKYFKRIILE